MPKFLVEVTYTTEGLKGLMKEKAAGRTQAVNSLLKSVNGKLEALYWCLGERDAIAIVEVADAATAASIATAVSASGAARTKTTPLLTAAELDAALAKTVAYRPPGG